VLGAGFAVAGAFIFAGTFTYPVLDDGHPGPSLFPRLIGVLMAGFGGALAVQGARARGVSDRLDWRRLPRSTGFVNALCVLAVVVGYVLLVERIGFLLVGTAMIFALMWRLRVPLLTASLVAVGFTTLVYALFAKLLRVPLPLGLLWW
jgi:putative tricarboxylic transport membrane protein